MDVRFFLRLREDQRGISHLKIYSCLLIAVLSLCVAARGDENLSPSECTAQKEENRRFEQARSLLRAGRYDAAISAYPSASALRGIMIDDIAAARRAKKFQTARRLYAAYFQFFPFGELQEGEHTEWSKAALESATLEPRSSPQAKTAQAYRALIKRMDEMDESERLFEGDTVDAQKLDMSATHKAKLALAFVEKHTSSRFAYPALAATADRCYYGGNDAPLLRFLECGLKILEMQNAPARTRILVLAEYAHLTELDRNAKSLRAAFAAYQKIRHLSAIAREKEWALYQAAGVAPSGATEKPFAASLRLYAEYLRLYPAGVYLAGARQAIVDSWMNARQTAQALQAIHKFEHSASPTEIAELLLLTAMRLDGEDGDPESLPILEETISRFPRQGAAAQASVWAAKIYGKRGDETKMIALDEKVATLGKGDVDGGERFLYAAQSDAIASLAAHYQKREQWKNALKWWRGWKSASWCGNAQEAQNSANAFRIYTCLKNLGRESEAIQTLEDWTFQPHIETTPGVIVTLVESYRERGQLSTLEAKLRAAPIEKKSLRAAQMALDYIELLHAKERGDIAVLWKPFERKSHRTLEYLQWQTKYGAKFLIEMGDKAKPFLLNKAKSPPKNEEDETADASSWACLLLAQMGAGEVLPVLQEKLKTIQSAQALKYRLWALRLLDSPESMALIDAQAKNKNTHWAAMARKVLALYPRDMKMEFLTTDEQLLNSGPGLKKSWQFDEYLKD